MLKRSMSSVFERLSKIFPIIGITGPRQSGKSTLAKLYFPHLPYLTLEDLDVREQALSDPRKFFIQYKDGVILDEVQNAPELLSYLQGVVDASPAKGRFVLTGSQNFALTESITQSLAGRIGMTTLLPLSLSELNMPPDTLKNIFYGGYPALYSTGAHPLDFYPSYVQTYIERDIRQLKLIGDLGLFKTFIKLCAGRVGQVINYTSLAQDCGISHTTARQWLTILEASYLVFTMRPFYKNFSKRLIKMPKLYFYDTGVVCSLLGLETEAQVETHYLKGALYENLVILEVLKGRLNRGLPVDLYFWRDRTGREIDLIVEWGGVTRALEIKSGMTFRKDFTDNVQYFCDLDSTARGYVIYEGTRTGTFGNTAMIPFSEIEKLLSE